MTTRARKWVEVNEKVATADALADIAGYTGELRREYIAHVREGVPWTPAREQAVRDRIRAREEWDRNAKAPPPASPFVQAFNVIATGAVPDARIVEGII